MSGRRVTVVASELLGRPGTGGAGTADSLLAVALGRHGHEVELLIASGRTIGELSSEWTATYETAGVSVRVLKRLEGVRPDYLAPAFEVYRALRESRPDVVIANEWRGLASFALRARQLGVAFADTTFVVHCHSPARVLAEFAGKVPDTLARFAEEVAERASIELADAVVSPSAWLLDWLRDHGWPVPDSASIIPYVRQTAALDQEVTQAPVAERVRRLAFFGQLREGKGIRIFLEALERLGPVEVVFLGAESKRWTRDEILRRVPRASVETSLTREAALAELMQPGTLAVMPSLLDNAPNTVSECIERSVPFVATATGGVPELVAAEDRERVLCRPTADSLASTLARALASRPAFAPARPAQDPRDALSAWLALVDRVQPRAVARAPVARKVAVIATGAQSAARAQRLASTTGAVDVNVVEATTRAAGLAETETEWMLFLDEEDEPDDDLLDALVDAQAASGADAVTSAVRDGKDGIRLFLGDPGALGLVENHYGALGLIRRTFATVEDEPTAGADQDWLLFARAALAGARIVAAPEPWATSNSEPGSVRDVPGRGPSVLRAFEHADVRALHDLPQLAATLAASVRHTFPQTTETARQPMLIFRVLAILRAEGLSGILSRAKTRLG